MIHTVRVVPEGRQAMPSDPARVARLRDATAAFTGYGERPGDDVSSAPDVEGPMAGGGYGSGESGHGEVDRGEVDRAEGGRGEGCGGEGRRGADGRGTREQVPKLRLDELLDELQGRIETVRGTRDRLQGLLEAVLSVGRELDLAQVLRRIVESAIVLVDAEYGALGVIGQQRQLDQFVPVGISDEERALIGELPSGHGLLGELIRHPEPLRLAELSDHPASAGFPPHHPPMHTFLGVPISVRDTIFGNLYLTEKRGGGEFDPEDEAVLSTLAVAAGVAIENARLYEQVRLRERWLAAGAEITSELLSNVPQEQVLEVMLDRAREITAADLGVVDLIVEGTGDLRGALARGRQAEMHLGLLLPREGTFAGAALTAGTLVTTTDVRKDTRITYGPDRWDGLGPAVAVPLGTNDGLRGVLMLARGAGRPPFNERETMSLLNFAGQAALVMELADRRRDAEQLSLLEDRDRIARDLHDLAIQRLFATGMTLQSAQRFVQHPQAADRLGRAVDDLDDTIKIIRSTIFGLRAHETAAEGLRVRVVRALEEAAAVLGFTPSLRMEGLLDVDVPGDVAEDAVAVVGEALTNVARHAKATAADVALVVRDGHLTLTVTDDGTGMPTSADGRRSGLRNLAERARRRGGELLLASSQAYEERVDGGGASDDRSDSGGSGTRLTWRVPLETHRAPETP
ncbi:GAF domain-containing protein [Streptomyces sp. NPDC059517]|uniref:sensor histidine kinase n=1 Tax=Streptomyces sp. NPDC059517 TaxID=3346855 RepID=UPI00368EA17D